MSAENQVSYFAADPSWSKDDRVIYDLLVVLGSGTVYSAVYHNPQRNFVALEELTFREGNTFRERWQQAINASQLLSGTGYRKVVLASDSRISTLVPNPLYAPGSAHLHLTFSNAVPENSMVVTDELSKIDARNIHAFAEEEHDAISACFPGAMIVHSSSKLIEHLSSVNKNTSRELIFTEVYNDHIRIVVLNGQGLLLHNTFSYENAEGLIYFILFTCEQLQLNPESVRLRFAGRISDTDPAFGLARKYFRDAELIRRPENFQYSPELDQLPPHQHFTLYLQALCVS